MNKILLIGLILFSLKSFSQSDLNDKEFNIRKIDFDGFKYNSQYYETTPRGLKTFLNDNTSDFSLETQNLLNKKQKNIAIRNTTSIILGWGLFLSGGYIMVNEALSAENEGRDTTSNIVFQGLGVSILGAVIKEVLRPKNRHYYNFINTINKKLDQDKIKIQVTMNYINNFNLGLAINF